MSRSRRRGLQQARAQLQQTREFAALECADALNKLRAAQAQMDASRGTAEQAPRAYQIATVRYREGISTQTDLSIRRFSCSRRRRIAPRPRAISQVARVRLALLRDLPLIGNVGAGRAGADAAAAQQSSAQRCHCSTQSTSTSASPQARRRFRRECRASDQGARHDRGEHAVSAHGLPHCGLVGCGRRDRDRGVVRLSAVREAPSEGHGRHRRRERRAGKGSSSHRMARFARDRRSPAR